jgi:hypothetical protein
MFMPYTLYDSGEGTEPKTKPGGTSIEPGIVQSNCDLIMQGKMLVRIPSQGLEVWARVGGAGGGFGRGMMFFPQPQDEVLVAFNAEDPRDAYILCGLWSNIKRLPGIAPTDPLTKRTIRSGVAPGVGHDVTLDDALQTITIRAVTGQMIIMSTAGIQIMANANTMINITAPPAGGPGTVVITNGDSAITMSPDGVNIASSKMINLSAPAVNINGTNVGVKAASLLLNS